MTEPLNAVWKPPTVGDLQAQINEQNNLIDALREQIKDQCESLRDKFAMAALGGILACSNEIEGHDSRAGRTRQAYKHADAMMEERRKDMGRK